VAVIQNINHLTFAVSNLDRSFDFYTRVLGLSPVARWEGGAYLLAGEDWIILTVDPAVRSASRPDYTHAAFTVGRSEFEEASRRVLGAGARVWKENTTEGASLYFLDPDGHKLELHASDLASRLAADWENPPPGMRFY
jgi:catechol 2,3-dioxygenase-like lactoylglutathione lyase family enzyme